MRKTPPRDSLFELKRTCKIVLPDEDCTSAGIHCRAQISLKPS